MAWGGGGVPWPAALPCGQTPWWAQAPARCTKGLKCAFSRIKRVRGHGARAQHVEAAARALC